MKLSAILVSAFVSFLSFLVFSIFCTIPALIENSLVLLVYNLVWQFVKMLQIICFFFLLLYFDFALQNKILFAP